MKSTVSDYKILWIQSDIWVDNFQLIIYLKQKLKNESETDTVTFFYERFMLGLIIFKNIEFLLMVIALYNLIYIFLDELCFLKTGLKDGPSHGVSFYVCSQSASCGFVKKSEYELYFILRCNLLLLLKNVKLFSAVLYCHRKTTMLGVNPMIFTII